MVGNATGDAAVAERTKIKERMIAVNAKPLHKVFFL
jgi:hypothetical protein